MGTNGHNGDEDVKRVFDGPYTLPERPPLTWPFAVLGNVSQQLFLLFYPRPSVQS